MNTSHSTMLFEQAQTLIPGGVNSPVRAFRGVGGTPLFIKAGEGPYLIDADNNRYVDYVGSWGPMILGHAHPQVIAAVKEKLSDGLSFGAPTELEVLLAAKITTLMPHIEMIRMVNSGTEATMSAIRLARGFTSRQKIIKFEGCYHGHNDSLLVKAGSGALTLNQPDSAGIPNDFVQHTLVAQFNDLDSVAACFEQFPHDIAAIIVEPVAGNMGCILPDPNFLPGLRQLCDHYGALLIFDEVMTGFRVALGGAAEYYQITPDLTTLGKIIGGGMPVGAFGGRRDIMQCIAPLGPVYQAGTLSGNPVAMAAGLTTLSIIEQAHQQNHFYSQLTALTKQLALQLSALAHAAGIPVVTNQIGAMFSLFFTSQQKVSNFAQVCQCSVPRYRSYFHAMLAEGIYFAPSAFEACFVSSAHQTKEMNITLNAAEKVFALLAKEGKPHDTSAVI